MLVTAALPRSRIHQSSPYRVTEKAVTKARDTGKAFTYDEPYRESGISPEKREEVDQKKESSQGKTSKSGEWGDL